MLFPVYDFKLCNRGVNDLEGRCGENLGWNVVALQAMFTRGYAESDFGQSDRAFDTMLSKDGVMG